MSVKQKKTIGVAALGAAALFVGVWTGGEYRSARIAVTRALEAPGITASAKNQSRRRIDGAIIAPTATNPSVVAVVIDDALDAQPASGVAAASLVIEAPVEGPITRLLAFFPADADVPEIGPVRSARPYFAEWVKEFNAVFAHVGGSPAGLDRIAQLNIRDLNEFSNGQYYWRSSLRAAPHQIYTSSEVLREAIADRGFGAAPEYAPWQWKADAPIKINPAKTTPPFYPEGWEYDQKKNTYRRPYGKGVYKTKDGAEVLAKNVVVLKTDVATIDAVLRKRIKTTGAGKAIVYQDGRKIDTTWKKKSPEDRLRFYRKNGQEVRFNAGMTWIIVTPSNSPLP